MRTGRLRYVYDTNGRRKTRRLQPRTPPRMSRVECTLVACVVAYTFLMLGLGIWSVSGAYQRVGKVRSRIPEHLREWVNVLNALDAWCNEILQRAKGDASLFTTWDPRWAPLDTGHGVRLGGIAGATEAQGATSKDSRGGATIGDNDANNRNNNNIDRSTTATATTTSSSTSSTTTTSTTTVDRLDRDWGIRLPFPMRHTLSDLSDDEHRRRSSRILLTTGHNSMYAAVGSVTSRLLHVYAGLWGYHCVVNPELPKRVMDKLGVRSMMITWHKVAILRHLIDTRRSEGVEWIIWLDGDVIVTNFGVRMEEIVDKADDNVHCIIAADWNGVNTGVWALRASEWSIVMLDRLLASSDGFHGAQFAEQSAFASMLRQDADVASAVMVLGDTAEARRALQVYAQDFRVGDFLLHLAGWRAQRSWKELVMTVQVLQHIAPKVARLTYLAAGAGARVVFEPRLDLNDSCVVDLPWNAKHRDRG